MYVSPAAKRRFKVLVVDDDPIGLTTREAALSDDFDVATAPSPDRALELLGRGPFDVVCSDYQMAGMNGLRLLQLAAERLPHVGCVLVTGSDDYLRKSRPGSDHYVLMKPCDPARLIAIIAQLARVAETKRSVDAHHAPGRRPALTPARAPRIRAPRRVPGARARAPRERASPSARGRRSRRPRRRPRRRCR